MKKVASFMTRSVESVSNAVLGPDADKVHCEPLTITKTLAVASWSSRTLLSSVTLSTAVLPEVMDDESKLGPWPP